MAVSTRAEGAGRAHVGDARGGEAPPGRLGLRGDGTFGPDEVVPAERIIGAWKVDRRGNLTGAYRPNREYRGRAE